MNTSQSYIGDAGSLISILYTRYRNQPLPFISVNTDHILTNPNITTYFNDSN